MKHTTLSEIKSHNPCSDGWATLTGALGPDYGDDTPLTYARILETNGIDDCMWALHYCGDTEGQKIMRLFAADCAERALSLYGGDVDPRSWAAVDVARQHARGQASDSDLAAAWSASDAASDAARAARAAAWAAAWAASDAARAAAWAAERQWQAERLAVYLTLGADKVSPMPERMAAK